MHYVYLILLIFSFAFALPAASSVGDSYFATEAFLSHSSFSKINDENKLTKLTQVSPKFAAHYGYFFADKYSVEVGAFINHSFDKSLVQKQGRLKIKGLYGSVLLHQPIYEPIDFIIGGGASIAHVRFNNGCVLYTKHSVVPRLVAGFETKVSDSMRLRTSFVLYEMGEHVGSSFEMRSNLNFGAGLSYHF